MAGLDIHNNHVLQDELLEEMAQYFPPGTSDADMLAIYNNPELFNQYMQDLQAYYTEAEKNYSVYQECVVPVVTQSVDQMWQILFFCLLIRLSCKLKLNRKVIHCISAVFGLLSLWKFYEKDLVYTVFPLILLLPFFYARLPRKGVIFCIVTTIYLIACEFYILDAITWNKIKGSVMIIMMKLISVVFDIDSGVPDVPSGFVELLGYLLNPASVIFGPFLTYKDYTKLFKAYSLNISWLSSCCRTLALSAICLVFSSCRSSSYLRTLLPYLTVLEENKWWQAYQDALSFRFSHYFVSYFSESACLISGIATDSTIEKSEIDVSDRKSDEQDKAEIDVVLTWSYPVAKIRQVELPGSLVDVVTNWNLPMHYWLKTYIYKTTRGYGVFMAVLITYIASSILHGMNAQLSAVLLTIGIFAYIEGFCRHVLACVFNACIEARPCKGTCTHLHTRNSFWVMAVNLLFAFLAVWNLAYLGCMFDNSSEEEAGYSWRHIHNKWMSFNYINHAVMFGGFVVHRLVSTGQVV